MTDKKAVFIMLVMMVMCKGNKDMKMSEQLLQADRQFAQMSLQKGAAQAFDHFLADSALMLPNRGMPIKNRESIVESMQGGDPSSVLSWQPQSAMVAESGEMGWTWGYYTSTTTDPDGKTTARQGKYLNIWIKNSQDEWKVLVDMGNNNPNDS